MTVAPLTPGAGKIKARAELVQSGALCREFLVYTGAGRYRVEFWHEFEVWDVWRITPPRPGRLDRNGRTWSRLVNACKDLESGRDA